MTQAATGGRVAWATEAIRMLEREPDTLGLKLEIPAFSAAAMRDREVHRPRGSGLADIASGIWERQSNSAVPTWFQIVAQEARHLRRYRFVHRQRPSQSERRMPCAS